MRLHCHCGGEVEMVREGLGVAYRCTRCGAFSTQRSRAQARREWEKNQEEPPTRPGESKPA